MRPWFQPGPGGGPEKPWPGLRRDHQVERVGGLPAVRPRIAERADELQELDHAARPAVQQQQRDGAGLGRADVQEVDAGAVDGGGELGKVFSRASCLRQS